MNHQSYGIARQLYRTSYSPIIDNSRPSSLNNSHFQHNPHPPAHIVRAEQVNPVLVVRDLTGSNLSISQSNQQELKPRPVRQEYYPEAIKDEQLMKQIQQRIDQISKRVAKNTQEINNIKQSTKNTSLNDVTIMDTLNKQKADQDVRTQECLAKISQIKKEVAEMGNKLTHSESEKVEKVKLQLDEKQIIKIRGLIEERVKEQTVKIKLIIQNEINKLSHDLRWQLHQDQLHASPFKSKIKYPFKSTKLTYKEVLQTPKKSKDEGRISTRQSSESPRSGKILMSNELVYYIDREGFLLDEDNYYLLDNEQKMIRLSGSMLQQLRTQGML